MHYGLVFQQGVHGATASIPLLGVDIEAKVADVM